MAPASVDWSTTLSEHQATKQGYSRHIDFWADARSGFACANFEELMALEREWVREWDEEGPLDAVWEAEFFEELMQVTPEEIQDAAPGTVAAVSALAMYGAAVVRSSNEGVLDEPPGSGEPYIVFFASQQIVERIAKVAMDVGLAVSEEDRELWRLAGAHLRNFPEFAHRLNAQMSVT